MCESRQTEKQTPSSAITHTVKITVVPAVCTMLMSPELLLIEWNHEQKVESRYQQNPSSTLNEITARVVATMAPPVAATPFVKRKLLSYTA